MMNTLIKVIITAVVGLFGSLTEVDERQVMLREIPPQQLIQCELPPETCMENVYLTKIHLEC